MSLYSIYTGFWVNWSQGPIKGATITLSARDGVLLLSFVAAFITVVGSQLWKILIFSWHQSLVHQGPQDGLHFQQRNILRNTTSPLGSAWFFLMQAWYWRGKATRLLLRTIPLAVLAIVYVAVFGLLAVFSSRVSKGTGTARLIRGQNCGIWLPTPRVTDATLVAQYQKFSHNALSAATYARACYGVQDPPPQCDKLPTSSLKYKTYSNITCPFGGTTCWNGTTFRVETETIDSHSDLGINAPPTDRVQYRRETTCTPANLTDHVAYVTGSEAQEMGWKDNVFVKYEYGKIPSTGKDTYLYNTYLLSGNVGYTIFLSYWTPSDDFDGGWDPIPELRSANGDLTLLFIAFNAMHFVHPCDDPVFWAHEKKSVNGSSLPEGNIWYEADQYVSVVACVEKHQICNPINRKCTESVGTFQVAFELDDLGLNLNQMATAERIALSIPQTNIYDAVNPRSSNALRAQEVCSDINQLYLPPNQWEIEVSSWVEDGLARLQYLIQEYATAPSSVANGSMLLQAWDPARSLSWNSADALMAPSRRAQCFSQRTNETQDTLSFSVLGLAIIFAIGGFILVLSFILELAVARLQRFFKIGEYQRLAWILDGNLQLQRMLHESLGLGTWCGQTDAVPTTSEKEGFESFDPSLAVIGFKAQTASDDDLRFAK